MSSNLDEYNKKRDFEKSGEPKGRAEAKSKAKLCYVVQRHMARREHYDFRLEWNGVLLSWAVPKGPSLNPADKRLSVEVEPHPLEYKDFEGTIPKGEYGGGTVMLWDEGSWEPLGDADKSLQEGVLKFVLHGARLKGKWSLIRLKRKEGQTVLDLGSGGGFDCFIARKRVGDTGHIIGVDMTPDMINLARKNADKSGYDNIEFRLGEIEHLPVADNSVDVIISNCVVNLSVDKEQVFRETFRVLKVGGRLSLSDVVATAEIPEKYRQDFDMISGCMGGAEHIDKIKEMLKRAGYKDIEITLKENSNDIIAAWAPDTKIEDYVASAIIEARKWDCGYKC